ncbi:AAA family ATPase [Actinomadura darangshiensis]|nr:AAA family ATPase [Actinomadura darangshiensis]
MNAMGDGDGETTCPYQGLAPFQSDRTELFFGRARATRDLLKRLASRLGEGGTVLLVSGASGVGKSSLLRAGLMPALADGLLPVAESAHWPRLLVTPSANPLQALAERWSETFGATSTTIHERLRDDPEGAAKEAGRFVLVVDQFEELFTLVADERERQAYVRALHAMAAAAPGAAVVAGVRADYWDRCAAYPQFAEAIQDGQVIVEPMTESDLRLAVTGPAAVAGLELEPGLVETILGDLRTGRAAGGGYEAGALPLLSQALLNTWERRADGTLTVRGYEESGRVRESVQRTADEVLGRLSAEDRKTALRIFRRMTLITAGGRVTRRTATLTELHAAASALTAESKGQVDALLSAFAGRRLLTLHEDAAEISHDALLTAWPALRQWLAPDLTAQAAYDGLVDDAEQWDENHRDAAFLYRGARLLAVDDSRPRWERDPDSFPPPGPVVEGFVAASARAARRAARRRRLATAGLAVLTVAALVAAGVAVRAAGNAEHQRRLALSRQLAAQSEIAGDPVLAGLLAVAAWRTAPTAQARRQMLDAAAQPGRGELRGNVRAVTRLLFGADGSVIVTGSEDGVVRLYDAASRRQLGAPIATDDPGCFGGLAAALSPDAKLLATACFRTVRFWDVASHRQVGAALDTKESVQTMAFSPDGRMLATPAYEGTVRLWDVAARKQVGTRIGRPNTEDGGDSINAAAFTPDGKRLVTAGADGKARVWDTATQRQVGDPFTGHTDDIEHLSLSADGTTAVTASADGTARFWSLATHEQIGAALRDPGSPSHFTAIGLSPDGKRLVTAGTDGYVRLWDTGDRRQVGPVLGDQPAIVSSIAVSPDGRTVAVADNDGAVRLWDATIHRQVGSAMPALSAVRFSPDGRTLAAPGPRIDADATGPDRAVRLWDVATQRQIGRPLLPPGNTSARENAVYGVRFGAGGRTVITRSSDGTIRLWDAARQQQIGSPLYADRDNWQVEFGPGERLLAVQRDDGSIGFWDVARHRESGPRITVPGGTGSVRDVAFSPDGAVLAVASRDRAVRLFDVARRRQIGAPLPDAVDAGIVGDLAFSPDGATLATTAAKGAVRLWDVASHRQIEPSLTGHTDRVTVLAFSPDGGVLATGSTDDTARLWDLRTHRQIGPPLIAHTGVVTGIAYSPSGNLLATVGTDRTARLWNVSVPADPAAAVCAATGRSLTRAEWRRYVPGEGFRRICG